MKKKEKTNTRFKEIKRLLKDLVNLFFPSTCTICKTKLLQKERGICLKCKIKLPTTNFTSERENPVEQIFWGKCRLENATSLLHYRKESMVKEIVHELKYRGNKEIGEVMGEMLGQELKKEPVYGSIDGIVALPLHPKRAAYRGYNQSELISRGISKILQKPIINNLVFRLKETDTQTNKNRHERWLNVEGIFQTNGLDSHRNKHILLVDDVITTGATIESCAETLLQLEGIKVSIATLAYATL